MQDKLKADTIEQERLLAQMDLLENEQEKAMKLQDDLMKLESLDNELTDTNEKNMIVSVSAAFSIFLMAIYLSFTIFNNTIKYKTQLYTGKMFANSRCNI